jgi:genome maintenance exonuclease 1|tara:strand:+ start:96 stop:743 length:648 start_codon:yes stop_codon:yes gene_type:complete
MKKFNHVGNTLTELQTENIDGRRFYKTPNGNYQSITTLLSALSKAGIQAWRKRVGETEANRISTKASRQGTAVHSLCEQYIKNEEGFLTESMPHLVEMFESIQPLLDRIDNVHVTEGALYSDELGLAGRTDLIAEFDGKLAIIDYKTSRRIKTWSMCHSYFMQGAFYAHAYEERTGIPINNIVIIMAVENEEPLLFRETKDRWIEPLNQVRHKYM